MTEPVFPPPDPPPMMVDPTIFGGAAHAAPAKNHANAWIVGILVGLLVIALLAVAAPWGSKDTPYLPTPNTVTTDYHNVADLQTSITETVDAKILQKGLGGAVTDVVCVPGASDNQFICNVQYTDNTSESVTVTVSPDGQTWVSQ